MKKRYFLLGCCLMAVTDLCWGAEAYDGESKGSQRDDQSSVEPLSVRGEEEENRRRRALEIALHGDSRVDDRSADGGSGRGGGVSTRLRERKEAEDEFAVMQPREEGVTSLMEAVIDFRDHEDPERIIEKLEAAIKDDTINKQSRPSGRTALMNLVERVPEDVLMGAPGGGDPGLLQRFLDAGADPNLEDSNRLTPLLIGVRERKYAVALRCLRKEHEVAERYVMEIIHLVLADGKNYRAKKAGEELLFCMIDRLRSTIIDHKKLKEWIKAALRADDMEVVEKLLIKYIAVTGVISLLSATDYILLSAEAYKKKHLDYEKFAPLLNKYGVLDMGLAIADRKGKKLFQDFFLAKGASRESEYYNRAMEEEQRENLSLIDDPENKGRVFKEVPRRVQWPTSLMEAAQEGDVERLRQAYEEAPEELGAITEERGDSALHFAVRNNHVECVKLLMDWGASPFERNDKGIPPCEESFDQEDFGMFDAVYAGGGLPHNLRDSLFTKVRELVITGTNITLLDLLSPEGPMLKRFLHLACFAGQVEVVELMLNKGVAVDQAREDGATPLFLAAVNGHRDVCELLLERGADMNQAVINGVTPLYAATEKGHREVCSLLLEKGATVDQVVGQGATTLIMAAARGLFSICKLLLTKEADVNKASDNGTTPLCMASRGGHLDVCKLLLDNDANVDKATIDGSTPLYVAAQGGHLDVCKLLLDNDANVDKATIDGSTPLYVAARFGHFDVCELLLNNGASVNVVTDAVDTYKSTALTIAAKLGYKEIVQLLLPYVDDLYHTDNDGNTALTLARKGFENENSAKEKRDVYAEIIIALVTEKSLREAQGILWARLASPGKKEEEKEGEGDEESSIAVVTLEEEHEMWENRE